MTPCICAIFHAITMLASELQRIGHRLHLVGTPRLRRADAAGVDHALERVDSLAPVEHAAQLAPEIGVGKVVGQERRSQQLARWLRNFSGPTAVVATFTPLPSPGVGVKECANRPCCNQSGS